MQRLFVAVNLPDAVKTQLMQRCSGVSGAKWVTPEQMHLTLRFIGEADNAQTERIKAGLAGMTAVPFTFMLSGVGQFPPHGKARVLWVGVQAPAGLLALQKQVEQVVVRAGFAPEARAFSPHITLARFRTPPPTEQMQAFLSAHGTFKSSLVHAGDFVLYASQRTPRGSIYSVIHRFGLK